jgi:2-polyprenyl-3-methyl-5-hydroxy-6-metoxy-1,4-benzoquinol methylase
METKAQSYYSNTRQDMMAFVQGNPNKILEIGCGIGGFRKNFHSNVEYWGIEPHGAAAEQAKLILTKTISGTYETAKRDIPDRYFDLVVCNDVIEHMTDPREFLKDVRSKLADNGKMIVSVPNLRNAVTLYDLLIKGDFQYVSAGVLDYTHFHLFTKSSFCKMAVECGWEVEICQPLPPQPFKPIKSIVLSCIKPFIPEIKSFQIAARLRPNTDVH